MTKDNDHDTEWTASWTDTNGNGFFPSSTDWASTWKEPLDHDDSEEKEVTPFSINPIQPNHEWKTPSDSPESNRSQQNDDENETAEKWSPFKWSYTQNDNENDIFRKSGVAANSTSVYLIVDT